MMICPAFARRGEEPRLRVKDRVLLPTVRKLGSVGGAWPVSPALLHRLRRAQVLRQEPVRLGPRLPGVLRVEPVELVPAWRVLVDLVLKRLAGGLQRLDQVLDL